MVQTTNFSICLTNYNKTVSNLYFVLVDMQHTHTQAHGSVWNAAYFFKVDTKRIMHEIKQTM